MYYTHSTGEITAKFLSRDRMEHAGHFPTHMEMCMDNHLTLITEKTQRQHFQDKTSEQSCSTHSPQKKSTALSHIEFPPDMENNNFPRETVPARKREIYGYRYIYIRDHHFDQLSEQVPYTQCTHTSGYRLQARESSSELPMTRDGKFQHGGISKLQCQC